MKRPFLFFVLALLTLVALIIWGVRSCILAAFDEVDSIKSAFTQVLQVTPQVIVDSRVVQTQTAPLAELAVVSKEEFISLTSTETYKILSWQVPQTKKTLKVSATYKIKAGYDLTQPFSVQVDTIHPFLTVKMPKPKILSVEMIGPVQIESESGYLAHITDEERSALLTELEGKAKSAAEDSSLRADADKQIKERLEQLWQNNHQGTTLRFQETEPPSPQS